MKLKTKLKQLFDGKGKSTTKSLQEGKQAAEEYIQGATSKVKILEAELIEARLQEYAGGESNAAECEAKLNTLKNEIQLLELAIQKFDKEIRSARKSEISKRMSEIKKEVESLQGSEAEKIDEFLKAAGKAAGLFAEISDFPSFKAGGHYNIPDGSGWRFPDLVRRGLPFTDFHEKKGETARRKKLFIDAFFHVNEGQPSISERIKKLNDEFHKLQKENAQVSA